jgi:hypothetical protein
VHLLASGIWSGQGWVLELRWDFSPSWVLGPEGPSLHFGLYFERVQLRRTKLGDTDLLVYNEDSISRRN